MARPDPSFRGSASGPGLGVEAIVPGVRCLKVLVLRTAEVVAGGSVSPGLELAEDSSEGCYCALQDDLRLVLEGVEGHPKTTLAS